MVFTAFRMSTSTEKASPISGTEKKNYKCIPLLRIHHYINIAERMRSAGKNISENTRRDVFGNYLRVFSVPISRPIMPGAIFLFSKIRNESSDPRDIGETETDVRNPSRPQNAVRRPT